MQTSKRSADLAGERKRFGLLCALPTAILLIIFIFIPTLNVFRMSVYKWSGYSDEKTFVGLANFQKLFVDPNFIHAFQTPSLFSSLSPQ